MRCRRCRSQKKNLRSVKITKKTRLAPLYKVFWGHRSFVKFFFQSSVDNGFWWTSMNYIGEFRFDFWIWVLDSSVHNCSHFGDDTLHSCAVEYTKNFYDSMKIVAVLRLKICWLTLANQQRDRHKFVKRLIMSKEQKCRELEKLELEREKRMASEKSSPIGCCN